ncbi:MAG: phage tail protein [Shinella sp.]|nr:MAG: phage tail protein [Shinella sp.]
MAYIVKYGGERLDRLAKKLMRTERLGTVEALLTANPGLATVTVDGLVPEGTVVTVPDFAPASAATFTLAWE